MFYPDTQLDIGSLLSLLAAANLAGSTVTAIHQETMSRRLSRGKCLQAVAPGNPASSKQNKRVYSCLRSSLTAAL